MSATTEVRPGAAVSSCGRYRYALWRDWNGGDDRRGRVCFVMLNPSTADEEVDDPTIRRCMGFARAWGYDGIIVVNLYAYRTTSPRILRRVRDPVGPQNAVTLEEVVGSSLTKLVVCAWGASAEQARAAEVLRTIRAIGEVPHALRLTKDGAPWHPLYLPKTCEPFAMVAEPPC